MAYQKLQVSRALSVVPSDDANIPVIGYGTVTGTTTATTADKLVDSGATFVTDKVKVGDVVYNTTDDTAATVTAVDSETTLSVNANIFASGEAYTVYLQERDNLGCVLYVGTAGDVKIETQNGDEVTFENVNSGQFMPINVVKVFSTGTTATGIIALW